MCGEKKYHDDRKVCKEANQEDSIVKNDYLDLKSKIKNTIEKFNKLKPEKNYEQENLVPSDSLIALCPDIKKSNQPSNVSKEISNNKCERPSVLLLNEQGIRSYGCKHYKRKCLIQFACCNRLYVCRLCHNKIEDHKCNRKDIKLLLCLFCMKEQTFSEKCVKCTVMFSQYICYECKFLSDDQKTYHCEECDVCRKGLRSHYFHCKQCNACLPIYIKEYHLDQQYRKKNEIENKQYNSPLNKTKPVYNNRSLIEEKIMTNINQTKSFFSDTTYNNPIDDKFDEKCDDQYKNTNGLDSNRLEDCFNRMRTNTHVENTLKSICPICAQDLFYSTSYVVLMNCGHSIHKKCLISYKNKSFQCPICLKSTSSNQTVNERIDYILDQCKDLNEQKNINSYECVTSCFDCQTKHTVKYKYLYNKCLGCGSYNTRINELYKRDDEDQSQS